MKESLIADSNVLIALFDGDKAIARKLLSADRVYVPSVVCGEIDAGSSGETRREVATREAFEKLLSLPQVSVLPVTRRTASYYANVFNYCRSIGKPIPTNDIWIAALALESGLPILTNDRHLMSLPLLRTVNS